MPEGYYNLTCTSSTVPPVLDIRFALKFNPSFEMVFIHFQLMCPHEEGSMFDLPFLALK